MTRSPPCVPFEGTATCTRLQPPSSSARQQFNRQTSLESGLATVPQWSSTYPYYTRVTTRCRQHTSIFSPVQRCHHGYLKSCMLVSLNSLIPMLQTRLHSWLQRFSSLWLIVRQRFGSSLSVSKSHSRSDRNSHSHSWPWLASISASWTTYIPDARTSSSATSVQKVLVSLGSDQGCAIYCICIYVDVRCKTLAKTRLSFPFGSNVFIMVRLMSAAAVKSLLTVIALLQQKCWSECCAQCR